VTFRTGDPLDGLDLERFDVGREEAGPVRFLSHEIDREALLVVSGKIVAKSAIRSLMPHVRLGRSALAQRMQFLLLC
jgi:hypothetical protein